jgi:hypothetical protein
MPRPAILTLTALDVLLLIAIAGCGGTTSMNSIRVMQSLMVAPATADAQQSANGQVQFTATGTFNMAPTTVMSPPVLWSVGNPSFMTPTPSPMPTPMPSNMSVAVASPPGASIDANGLAQCNGFIGMVTIEATAPADPNMPVSQMSQMTRNVTGMAKMSCP